MREEPASGSADGDYIMIFAGDEWQWKLKSSQPAQKADDGVSSRGRVWDREPA